MIWCMIIFEYSCFVVMSSFFRMRSPDLVQEEFMCFAQSFTEYASYCVRLGAITVTAEYTTSEEHLPEDLSGEITLQVTDTKTKEIFRTRARIAREPEELAAPESLTIVRGPHENTEEQWYIDILETDIDLGEINRDLLRECIRKSQNESNIVNARSDDLRALLVYLVEIDQYQSVSEAVRAILREHLTDHYPALAEEYVDLRTEFERDDLTAKLRGDEH